MAGELQRIAQMPQRERVLRLALDEILDSDPLNVLRFGQSYASVDALAGGG